MDNISVVLEKMVPELQELQLRGIFTPDEVKAIVKTRTHHEHLLQGRLAVVDDFVRAIKFEINLQVLKTMRKKRFGIKRIGKSDFAGETRVHTLFHRALKRFRSDKRLWHQYIDLCIKSNSRKILNKVFADAVKLFPKEASFWILAASHEFDANQNMAAARALLQRALRVAGNDSKHLWIEFFRLECRYVTKLRARREVLRVDSTASVKGKCATTQGASDDQSVESDDTDHVVPVGDLNTAAAAQNVVLDGAIPVIVFENAQRAFPGDVGFLLDLLQAVPSKELPDLGQRLAWLACEKHPTNGNLLMYWLDSYFPEDFVSRIEALSVAVDDHPCVDHVANLLREYDGLSKVKKMPVSLIGWREKYDTLIEKVASLGLLPAAHWLRWVNDHVSNGRWDDAGQVLRRALQVFPTDCEFPAQILRIELSRRKASSVATAEKELSSLLKVTTAALSAASKAINFQSAKAAVWNLLLQFVLEERCETVPLFRFVLKLINDMPPESISLFLRVSLELCGPKQTQKRLSKLLQSARSIPPYAVKLAIEMLSATAKPRVLRSLFDVAVLRYARDGEELWLGYIAYEMQCGNPEAVLDLHHRAIRAVADPKSFSRQYAALVR